jgi:asparaginyl-tRNA synthetase
MTQKKTAVQKSLPLTEEATIGTPRPLEQLSESETLRKQYISGVMTRVLSYLARELVKEGFEWLLPVVFSKSTDPLWPDPGASIEKRIEVEIYGKTVRPTLSMIVHKMVACSLAYPKLFTLSPNVRIERRERAQSGIHSYEFTQLDFEVRNATSEEIRGCVEKLIRGVLRNLRRNTRDELVYLGRNDSLTVPESPFRVYDKQELEKRYEENWETQMTLQSRSPFWITNIPREFYDFEDFQSGEWDNYDLFLPNYGEVLSGARREWQYNKIAAKMDRDNVKKENYELLLTLAKDGRLKPSSGAGIGMERLVSWIVGAKHIGEVQPFPKVPGTVYDL